MKMKWKKWKKFLSPSLMRRWMGVVILKNHHLAFQALLLHKEETKKKFQSEKEKTHWVLTSLPRYRSLKKTRASPTPATSKPTQTSSSARSPTSALKWKWMKSQSGRRSPATRSRRPKG